MNRKPSSNQKLVIGALGAAVILPILFVPVSATTSDGQFLVHAQDYNNPKPHEAYAGLKGLKKNADGSWSSTGGNGGSAGGGSGTGSGGSGDGSGTGGGTGTGGGGSTGGGTGSDGGGSNTGGSDGAYGSSGPGSSSDTSEVIGVYSSGPVKIRVTQDMLDFSAANVKAQEEGRSGDIQTAPNGWQTIWFQKDSGDVTQSPISLTESGVVVLSKSSSAPASWDLTSDNSDFVAFYNRIGNNIEGFNYFVPKSANTSFYYKKASGSGSELKEGRYISEDGAIIAVTVGVTGGSNYSVTRTVSASDKTAVASDSRPYFVNNGTSINVRLKSSVDGYNQMELSADGARFGVYTGVDRWGNSQVDNALRKNGPVLAYSNGDGTYSALMHADPSNADDPFPYLDGSDGKLTVATYNAASGQNWDGSLPKISSFDTAKPFTPQG